MQKRDGWVTALRLPLFIFHEGAPEPDQKTFATFSSLLLMNSASTLPSPHELAFAQDHPSTPHYGIKAAQRPGRTLEMGGSLSPNTQASKPRELTTACGVANAHTWPQIVTQMHMCSTRRAEQTGARRWKIPLLCVVPRRGRAYSIVAKS